MSRAGGTLTAALLLAVLSGCGSGSMPSGQAASSGPPLTVYAAASLKGTFTELGQRFEASHAGSKVIFSFAGSSDLVAQLQQGAPADVLASADTKNMDKAKADNLLNANPVSFASNTLQIAVPPGNPAAIGSFADLAKPGVKLVVCAPQVPCGSATQTIETATGVTLAPVSEESSVTDVLGKVQTRQADAGLVYVTDVQGAAGKVAGVPFPESNQAVNVYPIAVLAASKNKDLATAFVQLVTSAEGQQVLADAGFGKP